MNYSAKSLIRDGIIARLMQVRKDYENGRLTAKECITLSNSCLYTFIFALDEDDAGYNEVVNQYKFNFKIYENWVNEKVSKNEQQSIEES